MAALNPLPRWQRLGVWGSTVVLAASGLVWLALHYALGAGAGELPHPLEAWTMKLHGAAAMASLFFLGVVAPLHVPRGWRQAAQRRSGALMLGGMALLVVSGYLLYYFAPEGLRPFIGNAHAAVGVLIGGVLAWHGGRRARRQALR